MKTHWIHGAVAMAMLLPCAHSQLRSELPAPKGARPPAQPAKGPGGAEYKHGELRCSVCGDGDSQFWIFEPAAPASEKAPVVCFLHGWGAMDPSSYGAWIEHIVKRGNIVIFPRYQATLLTPMEKFTPNAMGAIKAALAELKTGARTRPDLDRVAVVGHSMGGAISANIAALAAGEGLPAPKAAMMVEPGDHTTLLPDLHMPRADLSRVPASTLFLVIAGEDDKVVGSATANRIFSGVTAIPAANKEFITLRTDRHGAPALSASHFAPAATKDIAKGSDARRSSPLRRGLMSKMIDAMDYYGTWKFFDGLSDAAFFGRNREYALGNTPQQRFMGIWSDGVPVKEPLIREPAK